MKQETAIFWFRRDLRLEDNAGLYHALKGPLPVQPVFIFDTHILDDLPEKKDTRIDMIRQMLQAMQQQLEKWGASLLVMHGTPEHCFRELLKKYKIGAVYTNTDYEPYATQRDTAIGKLLRQHAIPLKSYKDQVIFEKDEVVKPKGGMYLVFTPYSKVWKAKLNEFYLKPYPTLKYKKNFLKTEPHRMPSLEAIGFEETGFRYRPPELNVSVARSYDKTRDYPGIAGTTQMSPHLRFGTVSIRALAADAKKLNATLLNELIWREFYQALLWARPDTAQESFKKKFDHIEWRNNEKEFKAWCEGRTGYPIVDAGMRQLNETGWMHNRVRMITASFLCKHLLVDWRWGEAYFGEKLIDYDLASNMGGWQWVAGSGADASPYFRVFNPELQEKKYDKDHAYVRRWVPEFGTEEYPKPIVAHEAAKKRCLEAYRKAVKP